MASVSIDSHPDLPGATPIARIIDWGGRITLTVQINNQSMCWYLTPAEGESTAEYVERVSEKLGNVIVEAPYTESLKN